MSETKGENAIEMKEVEGLSQGKMMVMVFRLAHTRLVKMRLVETTLRE